MQNILIEKLQKTYILKSLWYVFILLVFASIISGCGNKKVKQKLGPSTKAPDEFAIRSYPPLKVPVDLKTIPEPELGVQNQIKEDKR
jgi:hypothetical protein